MKRLDDITVNPLGFGGARTKGKKETVPTRPSQPSPSSNPTPQPNVAQANPVTKPPSIHNVAVSFEPVHRVKMKAPKC